MVTTPVAPTPLDIDRPFTSPGAMFAPEIHELEARLPRHVLNALEAISRQMEIEIFGPLLRVETIEQLKEEFGRALPRYAGLYIPMSFLLWSQIPDMAFLASIWTPVAAKLKEELESRGAETIGEGATSDALVGLATISRVNRRLFELEQAGVEIGDSQELQSWTIAYWLAASCVFSYHFDRVGNRQVVEALAYWSRCYAAGVYRFARSLGVIKVPVAQGPVPETSEDDRILSEAGLEDLLAHLPPEDST